jgi:hypothetical protein
VPVPRGAVQHRHDGVVDDPFAHDATSE